MFSLLSLEKINLSNDDKYHLYKMILLPNNCILNNPDIICFNQSNIQDYFTIQLKNLEYCDLINLDEFHERYLILHKNTDILYVNYNINNYKEFTKNLMDNNNIIITELNNLNLSTNEINLLEESIEKYSKYKNTNEFQNIQKLNKNNELINTNFKKSDLTKELMNNLLKFNRNNE